MTLTEPRLSSLMAYCRIDGLEEGESELLETLYVSAAGYLAQAGVSEPPDGSSRRAQYDLCVNYLVLDGWDRRDVSFVGSVVSENPSFRTLLNQLKLTEPH